MLEIIEPKVMVKIWIIEDLTLSNNHIYFKGGGTKVQAEREVPAKIKDYPEPDSFGITPAYGFFYRKC